MTDLGHEPEAQAMIARVLADHPLKAAAFIVTIYGDVVEPRGGVAWMGNLIETCAGVGISETLVRTAVSRLVSANQLHGERDGRRSYYRLSERARFEYAAASDVLYGGEEATGWQFVQLTGAAPEEAMQTLERSGHARLNARLAVGPRRRLPGDFFTLVFDAKVVEGGESLRAFSSDYWDLAPHAAAYRGFVDRFTPLKKLLSDGERLDGAFCLTARLLLVHQFRAARLRDPRLPPVALPIDWPGIAAKRLFARLYSQLSVGADLHVAGNFVTASGALPAESTVTRRRLQALADSADD
jgi:phenylacetic acid degradation operon negative regulatory protein